MSDTNGNSPQVSLDDLYVKLPKNLPVEKWNYWMESQFTSPGVPEQQQQLKVPSGSNLRHKRTQSFA